MSRSLSAAQKKGRLAPALEVRLKPDATADAFQSG
jgi:hypothetical protein